MPVFNMLNSILQSTCITVVDFNSCNETTIIYLFIPAPPCVWYSCVRASSILYFNYN